MPTSKPYLHKNKVAIVGNPNVGKSALFNQITRSYSLVANEYLRNKGTDEHFLKDIWDDIRFLNTWIPLAESWPANVKLVRYEDLRADPLGTLAAGVSFLGIEPRQADTLEWSIQQCSKETMSAREDHSRRFKVVREDEASPLAIYSEADKAYFLDAYRRHLKVTIPYDLNRW